MQRLFLFLYNNRTFFFFLLLEAISVWLIIQNNRYQSTAFYNSANSFSASMLQISNEVTEYLSLRKANEDLANENAFLKKELERMKQVSYFAESDSVKPQVLEQFGFQKAKVINNSIRRSRNFLTLNKGAADGIKPGMGVVGPNGVVGRVKVCSENFSTVISLLHSDFEITSLLKRSKALCSTKWNGKNPRKANLLHVPKHVKLIKGDSVVTSGFSAVFPQGILIGKVLNADYKENETFVEVEMELSTDFSTISYVYIVENQIKPELDVLEEKSKLNE